MTERDTIERDTIERHLEQRLGEWRAPGESSAEERSRRLAAADFAQRPELARRRISPRIAFVALLVAAVGALTLTPAGAKVGDLVSDAVSGEPAAVKLGGFPHVGPLLVEAGDRAWLVEPDGSRHSVGHLRDPAWSPHGRYFAAVANDEKALAVFDPDGEEQWALPAPAPVANPAWSVSGYRIAFLGGGDVHVVAGDGSGDEALALSAPVGPAWRPPRERSLSASIDGVGTHQLTYVDRRQRIHLVDTDSGTELWRARVPGDTGATIRELTWSTDGSRLLVEYHRGYALLRRDGSLIVSIPARYGDVAVSPNGKRVAVVVPEGRSRSIIVEGARAGGQPVRTVLTGPGSIRRLDWAPHHRVLAIQWKGADNWVFIEPGGRASGVGDISAQFDADGDAFPKIEDWCCRAAGD